MRFWILFAAACHAASPHPADLATRAAPAIERLDPAQLERDTKYLASDELEGRAPGTSGGAKAEAFIAQRYAEIGLVPAGDHGTYFQDVPMREATLVSGSFSANGVPLEVGREVVLRGYPRDASVAIDQPLVFVGYGIHRPDLGYDDLQGVELHGAIAVIFSGAPRTLQGKPVDDALHAVLSDTVVRYRDLRDRGATAVLAIYDPARAERMPFAKLVTKVPTTGLAWMVDGAPASDPVLPSAAIDAAVFDKIAGAPVAHALWEQLDRGEHPHFDKPLTASLRITSQLRDITARNVVAMLPGGDLHDEIVAYTAHHDHLGIGVPVAGDSIYNGALDNAIGVAVMLEIARGLKALPHPPRRSILFVAVTGEEKGLLGSEYFVEHPTVPIERIVADINIDGAHPNYQVFDVAALGAEHSSLQHEALQAARAAGLMLSPDRDPAQVHFIRSDQYSFVKRGIPAIHPAAGVMDEHGGLAKNQAIIDAWESSHYHQPSDTWEPDYRAEWALPETKFELMLGIAVADADTRPTWNAGDVFGGVAKPAASGDSPHGVSPHVDASAKQP